MLKPKSLIFKVNAAILITYVVVIVFFGAIFLEMESDNRKRRFRDIELFLSAVFHQRREYLANEIFAKYTQAYPATIRSMQEDQSEKIPDIILYDNSGNFLFSINKTYLSNLSEAELKKLNKGPEFSQNYRLRDPIAIYSTQIKVMGDNYGYLKIHYDLSELKEEEMDNRMIFLAQIPVTFLILFSILNLLLFRSVIRPASVLRDTINRVRYGKIGEQVEPISSDEIGEIASDFNAMSLRLYEQHSELSKSREMLSLVIDNIPQMIFWQDNELIFLGYNKNFLDAVNVNSLHDIIGKTSYDLTGLGLEKSSIEHLDTLSKRAIKSDKPYFYTKMELFFYGKKGCLDANFIPLHNAEGEVVGILCSYENVTQKVKAEEETKQLQMHLMHMGRLTAMGEMAAGIAHEINQPLAIINSASDGLMNYLKGTQRYQSAKRIAEQIARAASIIDNMCSFVRINHGPVKEINLKKPIELALSFFKEQFRIHGILLLLDLAEDTPLVRVDSQKFEQIVVNLMINARYAVDQKTKISDKDYQKEVSVSLQCDNSNDFLIFEIKDNGIGMNQNVFERCLEPFFTTKEVGEGTGLGLSIVHSIIREFNMKIEIESSEGKGSTFSILIPIRRKENDYKKKDSAC